MKNTVALALFLVITGGVVVGNLATDCIRSYFANKAAEEAEYDEAWERLREINPDVVRTR